MSNLTIPTPRSPVLPTTDSRPAGVLGDMACAGIRLASAPVLLVADVASGHKILNVDVPPSIAAGIVGGIAAGVCAALGVSPKYGLAVCEGAAQSWLMKGVLKLSQGNLEGERKQPEIHVQEKKQRAA